MTVDARSYLSPAQATFWQWKEGGEVVAWNDGRTIAFRNELLEVLRRLAPGGLPPLGSVLLLLAATRDNWQEAAASQTVAAVISDSQLGILEQVDTLQEVLEGLEQISRLPAELRSELAAKCTIAEMAFEGARGRGAEATAREVVELLDDKLSDEVRQRSSARLARQSRELMRALHELRPGLARVQPAALRLRMKTGLDELPQAAELELSPAEQVRALLAELRSDEELQGLANLALKLMAAVTLPRKVSEYEEMPMGGFSDIANRGPLDRLLLSELALDDTTLAVRVAMNEALYLRRESPPKTPPQQRAILLEAGIRSWGVPRVYTTAVALALLAAGEKNRVTMVYRAAGSEAAPVDLTTRNGLIEHLAALEPDLHPGAALAAFRAEFEDSLGSEPVLVTTDEVVADSQFLAEIGQAGLAPVLLASVGRNGSFRLVERSGRGERTLREARFELEELFSSPQRVVPSLVDRPWARGLPAILSVSPFPLLLPHNIDPKRLWQVEGHGALAISNDRRLMHWSQPGRGAKQLADDLPKGALWWAASDAKFDGRLRAIIGFMAPNGLHVLEIDLDNQACATAPLAVERGVRAFCHHNGALFAIFPREVHLYDEPSREFRPVAQLPPGMLHHAHRFFRSAGNEQWYALAHDGLRGTFAQVLGRDDRRCPKLQAMFERAGVDGPVGVTHRGDLYSTATSTLRKVHHSLSHPQVAAVSANGKRIVLREAERKAACAVVDVDTLAVQHHTGDPTLLAEGWQTSIHAVSVRNNFTYIFVDDRGVLTLTSKKNRQLAIDYDPATDRIRLRPNEGAPPRGPRLTFKQVEVAANVGYTLTVATWDDGSQAFLDSRGLLHLKSADEHEVPECTIVLVDGELSGWCADGRMWGTPYFLGSRPGDAKQEIYESVIRGFTERI